MGNKGERNEIRSQRLPSSRSDSSPDRVFGRDRVLADSSEKGDCRKFCLVRQDGVFGRDKCKLFPFAAT